MYKCPIEYFKDDLIFNENGSCWAVYKLKGFDYDFLDDEEKLTMLNRTARFLAGVMSELQILMVPIEQNNKTHFEKLRRRLKKSDPLYEAAINHADQTEKYLEETIKKSGSVNDYAFYLVTKLQQYVESDMVNNIREAYEYFIKSPINAVNVIMNMDKKDILGSKLRKYERLAYNWFFQQNQKISMEHVSGEELQWLLRRPAFRGLNEKINLFYGDQNLNEWKPDSEEIKVGEETIVKPLRRDILNLFSGVISPIGRGIKIDHDNRNSYQSFLSITNIPDVVEFPGTEWIYMLQQYNCQAEMCIHIKTIEYRTSLRKIDGKKREINSQMEHIEEANADIPEDLLEGKEYSDALEMEVKSFRDPVLDTSITICLAADNEVELEEKVSTIKNAYQDMNFTVERSFTDQLKLYMQCLPSVGCIVKEYQMKLTPMTLSSGLIGAVHELGDKKGSFIGTTGAELKQVFLDMGDACLRNKSASATFFGNLGYGKSFNANLLAVLNVLYGGYSFIFDPKAERSHWEKDFTLLKGMITTVSLSDKEENRGKLDPYNIYKGDLSAANSLMQNVIAELLKINPNSDEYTALLEVSRIMRIESKKKSFVPSMTKVIEILKGFDPKDELHKVAKQLARNIELRKESGMAHLLIGDGSEKAINLSNRLNILQIQKLKLPSPDKKKDDYTTEENLSIVLMMVISHFAKSWALIKRNTFKCLLFDESWALGKTAEGADLYDFLSRMGRSLFTGCIFNGHSVLDLPSEAIKNTISYKFCFHTDNDSEAERMCIYLGLEATEANKQKLKELENAECLFRDLDGHVGKLKFNAVFSDLIEVFSTTPTTDDIEEEDPDEQSAEPDNLNEQEEDDSLEGLDQVIKMDWYKKEKCDPVMYEDTEINLFEREKVEV